MPPQQQLQGFWVGNSTNTKEYHYRNQPSLYCQCSFLSFCTVLSLSNDLAAHTQNARHLWWGHKGGGSCLEVSALPETQVPPPTFPSSEPLTAQEQLAHLLPPVKGRHKESASSPLRQLEEGGNDREDEWGRHHTHHTEEQRMNNVSVGGRSRKD